MRKLRRLLRNPTSTHHLHSFLYSLNDRLTTAMIAEALDRIEAKQAAAA